MLSRLRYGLIAVSLLALCSCDQIASLFPPAKHPVKVAKTQKIDAASFVEHLSIARIVLDNGGVLSDIADDGKAIEAYSKQKKAKAASLTLAVLEYTSGGNARRAIAPLSEKANFSALSNVLTPLNTTSYKLKEVRVLGVSVSPGLPIKITGQELTAVKQAIDTRHEAIAGSAHKIPPLQEARLQLKLLRFFMGAQQRDAAYISADNAKRILSTIPQDGSDAAAANQLAKDLEAAEGELRQTMPY